MCGILGIFHTQGKPVDRDLASKMLDTMAHRGPDDSGLLIQGPVALGHRRLSIIDLSQRGHQPMANEDDSVLIVFNGEIYNYVELRKELAPHHRFASETDTEVIIHAYEQWGMDCVKRFNGMFAFLLWDRSKDLVLGARDPMGIKPFYYHWDGSRLIVASEIKAIIEDPSIPRRIDLQAMDEYLTFQYPLGDRTLFNGIKKLEPGRILTLRKGKLGIQRFWTLSFDETSTADQAELIEELQSLLDGAIGRQLRSDVPVGCHLSGGVDSSIVASMAAERYEGRIKTFTARFREGDTYDESPWAMEVANRAGAEPIMITLDRNQFVDTLPKLVHALDEPTAGSGVFPQYFISRLAAENVKVVLGGQGGDELFGGYKSYRKAGLTLLMQSGLSTHLFRNKSNLGFLLESGPEFVGKALLGRIRHRGSVGGMGAIFSNLVGDLTPTERQSLLLPQAADSTPDPMLTFADSFNAMGESNPLNAAFRFDIENYLQALLHVEDRTSMMVSLESRVPLLDLEIARYAARIPPEYKVRKEANKYLLRQAGRQYLPEAVYNRKKKKGFSAPTEFWFSDPDFPFFRDYVFQPSSRLRKIFNFDTVNAWRQATIRGGKQYNGKLWKILWLAIWFDTFKVSI